MRHGKSLAIFMTLGAVIMTTAVVTIASPPTGLKVDGLFLGLVGGPFFGAVAWFQAVLMPSVRADKEAAKARELAEAKQRIQHPKDLDG